MKSLNKVSCIWAVTNAKKRNEVMLIKNIIHMFFCLIQVRTFNHDLNMNSVVIIFVHLPEKILTKVGDSFIPQVRTVHCGGQSRGLSAPSMLFMPSVIGGVKAQWKIYIF